MPGSRLNRRAMIEVRDAAGVVCMVEKADRPGYVRDRNTGALASSIANIEVALTHPSECGWEIKKDVFRDEIMLQPVGAVRQVAGIQGC